MFYYYISTLMKDIDITINLIKLTGIISPRKQIIKKYPPPTCFGKQRVNSFTRLKCDQSQLVKSGAPCGKNDIHQMAEVDFSDKV